MSILTTAVGNNNILANRIVVDMSETIAFLEPNATPLVVLTKRLNTAGCHQPKYEWMDNNTDVRWTAVTDAAGVAAAVTTVNVTTGTGANIAVDDLIKNSRTGEVFKVTKVETDKLTVARGIGASAGIDMVKDDKLLIIGNAAMQGSGAPAEKVVGVSAYHNYTQIFKTAFSVTNTLDATKLYGMKELARLRKNAGIKHAKDMEYAFLFGTKSIDVTGSQPVTTTEGIMTTLASNPNNVSKAVSAVEESDIVDFCEKVFTYGGSERTCLCSPNMLSWIAKLASSKLQLIQGNRDTLYGIKITEYLTPFGVLKLVMHPLLVNGYASTMVALATEDLYYRPLTGRDTKLITNVQDNDEDGQRDMYITEAGCQLRLPLKHGIFQITADPPEEPEEPEEP
jgi:hypothetical protein